MTGQRWGSSYSHSPPWEVVEGKTGRTRLQNIHSHFVITWKLKRGSGWGVTVDLGLSADLTVAVCTYTL